MTSLRTTLSLLLVATLAIPTPARAAEDSDADSSDPVVEASITGELGFLDPLAHEIQFGRGNEDFDYVDEGGQDVLFNFQRISGEFEFADRHHAILLYQPLRIESRVTMKRNVTFDNETFFQGTPVDVTYGFPFYRASYLYDFDPSEEREIAAGLSLQLRNATIGFTSADGSQRFIERNVGPVPILKFRTKLPIAGAYWFGAEADGFYAPVSYLNGDDNDVVGAILDASLRGGRSLGSNVDAFVNLRYLGGGSTGEDPDDAGPNDDGFTKNWLHFATVSLGFTYHFR